MKYNMLLNYLRHRQIFILSPHFDDAILSLGTLLYHLKNYDNIKVINCFTQAHAGPYTLSTRRALKTAGYPDAMTLYHDRALEDRNALSAINARYINLGLNDALFRMYKNRNFLGKYLAEFNHIYPTYKWHVINKINSADYACEELESKLKKIIGKESLVFAPFGIGNHVDHLIASSVAAKLFKNLIYYVDFPYFLGLKNFGSPPNGYIPYNLEVNLSIKTQLTKYYTSQFNSLFKNGILPDHQEKFFLPKQLFK